MVEQTDETHVHALTIMASQINSGMMTFPVQAGGMGNHTHMLTLTAGEIMQLRMGMTLTDKVTAMDSTNHTHTYTIACA
jgi:VCBS repeat-containing protein